MENLLAVWKSKMGARESWITRRNTVDCTIDSNMNYHTNHPYLYSDKLNSLEEVKLLNTHWTSFFSVIGQEWVSKFTPMHFPWKMKLISWYHKNWKLSRCRKHWSPMAHMCFGRIIVSELIRWKQMLNFYANICLQTFLGEYSHDRSSRFVANYFTFIKPFMIQ